MLTNLPALASALRTPELPRWRRWAVLAVVLYVLFPLDVVPDALPVFGLLDDGAVVTALLAALLRWRPRPDR